MRVEYAPEAREDLRALFQHLFDSHRSFGRSDLEARDRAAGRVRVVEANGSRLARTPGMGTRHDDLLPGLRHVTIERAIYWFTVDESAATVRVLAIHHGGQDHVGQMLQRLTGEGEAGQGRLPGPP